MRSVVEAYRRDGVFQRHDIRLIETHDEGSAARRLLLACRAMATYVSLLLRGNVSAVHIHMAMRGSFWRKSVFAKVAGLFSVPVVAHLHGSEMEQFYGEQPRWRQRLICSQLQRCHTVLVLSRSWGEFVTQISPCANVVELPNYVRLPELTPRLGGRGTVDVLFLGLVGRRKGVYDLLRALAIALPRAPALRLRIGGNGDIEQAQRLADEFHLADTVEFLGWVTGAQKDSLLANADAYVLPSHNEGLPMSVLEAMSFGLPVITTNVGGIPELLTSGQDGLLVSPGDIDALAEALVTLALDSGLRNRLGQQARKRIEKCYSDRSVLPRLEAVYKQLHTTS
jgi:glycosyltransferase involved in cell wall biosynthesis